MNIFWPRKRGIATGMSDAGRSLRSGLVKPGAAQERSPLKKSRENIRPATRAPGGRIDEFECHRHSRMYVCFGSMSAKWWRFHDLSHGPQLTCFGRT
jgi:hypothetical protein